MSDDIRQTLQHHGRDIHSLKKWRRAAHVRIDTLETGHRRMKRTIRQQETSTAAAIAALREELGPLISVMEAAMKVRRTYHLITWAIVVAAIIFTDLRDYIAGGAAPPTDEQAPFMRSYSDLYEAHPSDDIRGRF